MMPPICPIEAPPGEQIVFHALASNPKSEDWVVLHSLNIAQHTRHVQGEADFVVIVPGQGIAVIEVKSHLKIERLDDGRWQFGNHPPSNRSPFVQASDALHSLRQHLVKLRIDLSAIPIVSCVWFTNVRTRGQLSNSPEWHDWQHLDQGDLDAGAPESILRVLSAGREHLKGHLPKLRETTARPDSADLEIIARALRPHFELASVPGDIRRQRDTQLRAFVEEQFAALDAMADNQAVLFTGPAGSGKTFLAVEAARRELAVGRKGRLICFNNLLSKSISQMVGELKGLHVSTLHQELLRIAAVVPPKDANSAFWTQELVDLALERMLDDDPAMDFLIIDEFQDLARPEYWDALDLLVRGGLASGRIILFGDFEGQALHGLTDGRSQLRLRAPSIAMSRLTTNCRNRPRIGAIVQTLSKMSTGYARFRRDDDGIDPDFVLYNDPGEQDAMLLKSIRSLRDEGYKLEEIAVLSPLRLSSVCETTKDQWLKQVLVREDASRPVKGKLRFSTVHSFKGLEAPAIILTDIDARTSLNFESVLYVGLTRATDRLIVIAETDTLRAQLRGRT